MILLTVLFMFFFSLPYTIYANDDEYKSMSQFCKANNDLGYASHGKCVSVMMICENFENDGPVCTCKTFLNNDPTGFYEMYNSIGECINFLDVGYVEE